MPRGFIVSTDPPLDGACQFSALPIRIGRNALNDFPLQLAVVSDFHARIEEVNGTICIVDVNSKNGTYVRGPDGVVVKVPAGTPIRLDAYGFEFLVGPKIRVRLQTTEVSSDMPPRSTRGTVLGNRNMLGVDRQSAPPPSLAPVGVGGQSIGHSPLRYPGSSTPPPQRYVQPSAPVGHAPSHPVRAPAPSQPPTSEMGTAHIDLNMETLAMVGLRELASSLVPSQSIRTTGDLARLITRLHDAIEVFCRCFIPLRQGYSQFVSSMDLRRAASQRGMYRSQGYRRVETAQTPDEVAAALLDFNDRSLDSAAAIEGIFADLMVHQVALLEGVMRGVHALLEELSPESIEAAIDEDSGAFALKFGRQRALWQEFCRRFDELSEDKQAFQRIFGPEFAEAYHEHGSKRDP
jgi:type VI secretion system protein ImpI